MTKNFLPFWAFPVADKLTSVPFFPNLKILKPYGDHNLEHDLKISSRHLSVKTPSPKLYLGRWTQHKCGNVVDVLAVSIMMKTIKIITLLEVLLRGASG